MRLRPLILLPLLAVLALLLAGCGGGGDQAGWVGVPDGKVKQVDLRYHGVRMSCFVYAGSYAGNLECHRQSEQPAHETVVVPTSGVWVHFSAGKVRMVPMSLRGVLETCLAYSGSDRGSIDCPEALNPR